MQIHTSETSARNEAKTSALYSFYRLEVHVYRWLVLAAVQPTESNIAQLGHILCLVCTVVQWNDNLSAHQRSIPGQQPTTQRGEMSCFLWPIIQWQRRAITSLRILSLLRSKVISKMVITKIVNRNLTLDTQLSLQKGRWDGGSWMLSSLYRQQYKTSK